ncbi:purine nucleotide binding protein [Moniliophthora roreri MCA 2997]|uniref:Replication factor C subunit 1 n=1 Tax=Moniliophthora roreri (strain MCA 2997) TaxID=1381753 RepID=V2X690_MONRO|nr:purine nucleotide binding protein [Moniliophthora roreri MCA 2997]
MASSTKNTKSSGKDIRNFFGGSGSGSQKSQPTSSLGSTKGNSSKASSNSKVGAKKDNTSKAFASNSQASSSKSSDAVIVVDSDDEPVTKSKSSTSAPKRKTVTVVSSDEEEAPKPLKKKPAPAPKPRASTSFKMDVDEDEPAPKAATLKRKKATALLSSDDEQEQKSSPPKKKAATASSKTAKPKAKKAKDDDYEDQDEDDAELLPSKSKSKVPAKKTAAASEDKAEQPKKPNWAAMKAAKLAGPVAHGTKQVPDGDPNCLMGLSFVFTGELSAFSREEAIDIAKRFGGRVVGQPSSKTDYVVLGGNAGPSKLNAIKKHDLHTLNEDEFLNLIATRKGSGKLDEKTKKKMEKEQEEIKKAARELEKREREAAKEATKAEGSKIPGASGSKFADPSMQLWTTRYAPQTLKEICGNKDKVEKLLQWLNDWANSYKAGFKKPGKNGMNMYRAVLITGSPGIGKTTSAHLCAKLAGYTPIELNASDTRSKKLVENGMNINNASLDGFISGSKTTNSVGVALTDRSCLIMDEVDGMSAGDRGGVGALNALIKKTKIPIICVANDKNAQKLKPLMSTTFGLSFSKPQASMIRSRIMTIAYKEKMKLPANVVDQLVQGSQSDIRQILNMLSTWKLSNDTMDFDESKALTKMNEKYTIMSPFDITTKVLGPYLFSATSRETLGDKMEYYFQDHSFVPLFIQENYLKSQPAKLRNEDGPDKVLRHLQLMDKAASSISDADLVDGLIHGPEQHWSLMPLHAICSTVRPASFMYGNGVHFGGPNSMSFPQWLGQNSRQNKLSRQLTDVQARMRLKVSGDKAEIRQSYIPALFPHIVKPLADEGASAVDEVIQHMDEYYLSREDWDTIVELGVGDKKDDLILKKIPPAVKTAFTRKYNAADHPIPFHKATDIGKVPKKLAAEPAPDLEEAFDLDEVPEDVSEDERSKDDSDDIGKDKLIQTSKAKKPAAKGTPLGQGRRLDHQTFLGKPPSNGNRPTSPHRIPPISYSYGAPVLGSRSPPKPNSTRERHQQPLADRSDNQEDESALARFARVKQQQNSSASSLNPEKWSVKDTSVNIATAFHQAVEQDMPQTQMNPNSAWASGSRPASTIHRGTSVEYEAQSQSTSQRRLAPPPSRTKATKPLSKNLSQRTIPDSEEEDTQSQIRENGRGKSPMASLLDVAQQGLTKAVFFARQRSQEPENSRENGSYDYSMEEREYQASQQANTSQRSFATHKRNKMSLDNKAYKPSRESEEEEEDDDVSDDGRRRRRKKKKNDNASATLRLPVISQDKRRKRKGKKGGAGGGEDEESESEEGVEERPPSRSASRAGSRAGSVPRYPETFLNVDQGLQHIPEVDEEAGYPDPSFLDTSHDPSSEISKSYSESSFSQPREGVGARLGTLVFNFFSLGMAGFSVIAHILGKVLGMIVDIILVRPAKTVMGINRNAVAAFSKYLFLAVTITSAWYLFQQPIKGLVPNWPSRGPINYTPPSMPAADMAELNKRLQDVEAALSALVFETEQSKVKTENGERSRVELVSRLTKLEGSKTDLNGKVASMEKAIFDGEKEEKRVLSQVKRDMEVLREVVDVLQQRPSSGTSELPEIVSGNDEEARARLKTLEERVGTVEGGVKEALELGKHPVKTDVGSPWWNKLSTGKKGLTIKSSDGQDVTSLIGHLVENAFISFSNKDVIARPDFALFSGGGRVIPSLTSPTFELRPPSITSQVFGWVLGTGYAIGRPPVTALHHELHNGHCWPFAGTEGMLGLSLASPVLIDSFTIDHVAKEVAFDVRSAPREMEVWGLVDGRDNLLKVRDWVMAKEQKRQEALDRGEEVVPEQETGYVQPRWMPNNGGMYVRIAEFAYNVHLDRNVQSFPISEEIKELGVDFGIVVLRVKSNWGRDEFTCLYRLRVHGELVGEIPAPHPPPEESS